MLQKNSMTFMMILLSLLILSYTMAQSSPNEEVDLSDFIMDPNEIKPSSPSSPPSTTPSSVQPTSTPAESNHTPPSTPNSTDQNKLQESVPSVTHPNNGTSAANATPSTTTNAPSPSTSSPTTPTIKNKTPETPAVQPPPSKKKPSGPEIEEGITSDSSGLQSSKHPVRIMEERGTQHITLSGFIGTNYIYRNELFADAHGGSLTTNLDEDFFDLRFGLQAKIQLNNNIQAIIELQSEPRAGTLLAGSLDHLYIANRTAVDEFELHFEKAYIQVNDFLFDHLNVRAGIIPHKYALRADSQSFFLDLGEAESPFATRADTHAMGILATYQPLYPVTFYVDTFYFVTAESSFQRQDEKVFGLNLDLYLNKKITNADESTSTLVRFFYLTFAGIESDNQSPIWSIGGGLTYMLSGDPQTYLMEAYGEAVVQVGDYDRPQLKEPFTGVKAQDHFAFGGYAGLRFSYEKSPWKPYVDVSAWYISGDDDAPDRTTNHDFVSYEDVDDAIILEDNDYGMDIDSNYWAIKFKTGINLKPLTKEELRLDVFFGHFQALDVGPNHSKNLGEEIDIRLTWEYSSDLTFSLVGGYLFHSRFLQQVYDEAGAKGRQNAFIIRLESMLRF